MNKITVIGCAGSGKTTFSKKLADKLNIPLYTIDVIYRDNLGQKISQEELREKLIEVMQGDKWIIDGQYTKHITLRLEYVDTVIFFDTPKSIAIWRIFKRYLEQKDVTFLDFLHQIKLVINYPNKYIYNILNDYSKFKNLIVFKKHKDADIFLNRH